MTTTLDNKKIAEELSDRQKGKREELKKIGKQRRQNREYKEEKKKKEDAELNEKLLRKLSLYKQMLQHLHELPVQTAGDKADILLVKTESQSPNDERDGYYRINFVLKERDICIRAYEINVISKIIMTEYGFVFKEVEEFVRDAEDFVLQIVYA